MRSGCCTSREDLVAERTRHQNRLRWHLVELHGDLEARLPARGLDRISWRERIVRRLERLPRSARVRVARDESRRIRELTRAERAFERALLEAIRVLRPDVLAEGGIAKVVYRQIRAARASFQTSPLSPP